jgi:hypothetical protein
VIGTVSSDEKAALAKAHGCDHTIIYTRENFTERVKEITGGKGVRVVYDSIGKDTFMGSLECLQPLGHDGAVRRRLRPGAALRPGPAGQDGIAVHHPADAVHLHRAAQATCWRFPANCSTWSPAAR